MTPLLERCCISVGKSWSATFADWTDEDMEQLVVDAYAFADEIMKVLNIDTPYCHFVPKTEFQSVTFDSLHTCLRIATVARQYLEYHKRRK
jgi:hypothetical protein